MALTRGPVRRDSFTVPGRSSRRVTPQSVPYTCAARALRSFWIPPMDCGSLWLRCVWPPRPLRKKDPETEETTSKEVNVTGVYCVSGAKARFKPVEVLLTGDDYAVVRSAGSTEKLRLRPGDEIIVAARDLYDGKVVS